MTTVNPAPMTDETWVAVLLTLARQLSAAGKENAAARVYDAVAEFVEDDER